MLVGTGSIEKIEVATGKSAFNYPLKGTPMRMSGRRDFYRSRQLVCRSCVG